MVYEWTTTPRQWPECWGRQQHPTTVQCECDQIKQKTKVKIKKLACCTPSSLYRAKVSNFVALRLTIVIRMGGTYVRKDQWIFGPFLASEDHTIWFYVLNPVSNY